MNSFSPCASVLINFSFSSNITLFITSLFFSKSGYISFKFSIFNSIKFSNSSNEICSLFMCLIILRINFLSTYPLSIFDGLPPSHTSIILERRCSAIIRLLRISSIFSNFSNFSIIGKNISVSNGVSFPSKSIVILSSPNPVSTFFCDNLEYFPSLLLKYSIKTLFHISTYLPHPHDGLHSGEHFGFPVS